MYKGVEYILSWTGIKGKHTSHVVQSRLEQETVIAAEELLPYQTLHLPHMADICWMMCVLVYSVSAYMHK